VEDFDIFLSHNSADKPAVEDIAHKLKDAGVEPWLDKWYLVPGKTFQSGLTEALRSCRTCAVFIGPKGVGDWAREEVLVAQDRAANEPARHVRPGFEPGLVDIILRDVASEPGALPLLEHALLELWKRRRDHTLTLDGYRESGGVKGAIAKTAEEIFKNFSPDEQGIVRRIMLRLTKLGEGTEDTRRSARIDEIVTTSSEASAVERVIKAMVDARLLTIA